jgi:hypothetical protein
MILVALEIIGYWVGMGTFMWIMMYSALVFAKICEFIADRIIH